VAAPVQPSLVPPAGTRRPAVAVLRVGAVPGEVAPLAALVALHAGVEPPPADVARCDAAPRPRPGHRHPDPASADLGPVGLPLGVLGVFPVPEDDEGEAGRRLGHPDFFERAVLAEDAFEVPLFGVGVEIGDVQAEPLGLVETVVVPRTGPRAAAARRTLLRARTGAGPSLAFRRPRPRS